MPNFRRLDPDDVSPHHLVNREELVERVSAQMVGFLTDRDTQRGQSWLLHGDKGVGKSIVSRAILRRVEEELVRQGHPGLFVVVDCRRVRTWRDCLRAIVGELRKEMEEKDRFFPRAMTDATVESLRAIVGIVNEILVWDTGELRELQETVTRFSAAAKIVGSATLALLKAEFTLDLSSARSATQTLTGVLRLDERRVSDILRAVCADLTQHDCRPLFYLDNVDELDHRYTTEAERDQVRREVEGIVTIRSMPAALLLNMRSYFSTAFNRVATRNERVDALSAEHLCALVDRRISVEDEPVRSWFAQETIGAHLPQLVEHAGSPFALLKWLRFLGERDRLKEPLSEGDVSDYVSVHFASVPEADLRRVVMAAFRNASGGCSRKDLLVACEGDATLLQQLIELQAVLPVDFWNPISFTLDPELRTAHARWSR